MIVVMVSMKDGGQAMNKVKENAFMLFGGLVGMVSSLFAHASGLFAQFTKGKSGGSAGAIVE